MVDSILTREREKEKDSRWRVIGFDFYACFFRFSLSLELVLYTSVPCYVYIYAEAKFYLNGIVEMIFIEGR